MTPFRHVLALVLVTSALPGCTAGPRGETTAFGTEVATSAESTTVPTTTATSSGGATEDSSGGTGILDVSGTGGYGIAEVFGHSADTLYRLDPETKAVTVVGPFGGCQASIIDIALDAGSQMYGVAYGSLYSIDRVTGQCTFIASGQYPTSLSFVPAGTVDPNAEALVGFVDEQYVRIDVQTGAVTMLGALDGGLASSGDLVSVEGGGTYLTVTGPGCDTTDCIIEIDPADGTLVKNWGALPYAEVFGLAFWAGRAYGFARSGVLFEIDFDTGGVTTTPIPIPGAPADLEFFGAGSTTAAPPVG